MKARSDRFAAAAWLGAAVGGLAIAHAAALRRGRGTDPVTRDRLAPLPAAQPSAAEIKVART